MRFPSIDKGVTALVWAIVFGAFVYFGLLAVGATGATSIVVTLVVFGAVWLFVRLRGEDDPADRRRP